jgi:hypothetical protein
MGGSGEYTSGGETAEYTPVELGSNLGRISLLPSPSLVSASVEAPRDVLSTTGGTNSVVVVGGIGGLLACIKLIIISLNSLIESFIEEIDDFNSLMSSMDAGSPSSAILS